MKTEIIKIKAMIIKMYKCYNTKITLPFKRFVSSHSH